MDLASLILIGASALYLLIVLKRYGGVGLLQLVVDAFSGWVVIPIGFGVGIFVLAARAPWTVGYLVGAWLLTTAGWFHVISSRLEREAAQEPAEAQRDRARALDALRNEPHPGHSEGEKSEMKKEVKCPHCGGQDHWHVNEIALQGRVNGTGPWYMGLEAVCCKQCMHVSFFSKEDRDWWAATEMENA